MKISLALPLLLITSLFANAGEMNSADSAALLKRLQDLRDKEPAAQADFREEKATHLLTKPLVTEGTVSFEAPGKFRREVKGSNASLTVSDGKTMWVYYSNFKEAEHYSLGQRSFFDDALAALTAGLNFEHIEEFYNFHAFKEPTGYQFQLTPKKPNLKRILDHLNVWMDEDYKVQKTELYQQKGDHIVTNFTNVHHLTSLPAGTFEFTPPADAHISYPLGK